MPGRFSIVNSLAIVLLLTGIVAMIMMRTLRRDFNRYNEQDKEDLQEESGWKLVHADVFRPPVSNPMLFCVMNGSGVQLLIMASLLIFFSAVGFLSPARRGSVVTWFLVTSPTRNFVAKRTLTVGVFGCLSSSFSSWAWA